MLQMYAAFGLGASLKKVLNFRNMLLYAEFVMDNMEFPRGLPSVQDDMFQVVWHQQIYEQKRAFEGWIRSQSLTISREENLNGTLWTINKCCYNFLPHLSLYICTDVKLGFVPDYAPFCFLFSSWEVTFCWTNVGECCFLTAVRVP